VNAQGERFWVKFPFKTYHGIKCLTSEEAAIIGGRDPSALHKDMYDAIARKDYPLIPIAKMVLGRVPENFFAEVEQVAWRRG